MTHRQDVSTVEPAYTRHCFETPPVSPCRSCDHRSRDKNSPPCEGCNQLRAFQGYPVNLAIDHKDIKLPAHEEPGHSEPSQGVHYRKLKGILCGVCGKDQAYVSRFKDLYEGFLCRRCYYRLQGRFRRYGRIYLPNKPGEL